MLGIVSYFDTDTAMVVALLAGIIYTLILWASLNERPETNKFWSVLLILGIANFFSMYAAAPLILIPKAIADYFMFIFPSCAGAVVTLLCVTKMWHVSIIKKRWYLILSLVIISSALFTLVNMYIRSNYYNYGFTAIFNTALWWFMFSLGLVIPLKITNQSKQ